MRLFSGLPLAPSFFLLAVFCTPALASDLSITDPISSDTNISLPDDPTISTDDNGLQTTADVPSVLQKPEIDPPAPLTPEDLAKIPLTNAAKQAMKKSEDAINNAQQKDQQAINDANQAALATNTLLVQKGLLKNMPAGTEQFSVGALGTESNAVLQHIQGIVGIYSDEIALPDGDPRKVNAGQPTPATMAAINALPNGDGSEYTQADIDAAKQAAQKVLHDEQQAKQEEDTQIAAQKPEKVFTVVPGR